MSIQSLAGLGALSGASSLFVPALNRALSQTLSAQARLSSNSGGLGTSNAALSRLASQAGVLRGQATADQRLVTTYETAQTSLQGVFDSITEAITLATSAAASGSVAERTELNAAAQALIGTVNESLAALKASQPGLYLRARNQFTGGSGAAATTIIKDVRVRQIAGTIPTAGFTFTFDVTNTAAGTGNRSGARAVRASAVLNTDGDNIVNQTTEFSLEGNRGAKTYLFAAGTSLVDIAAQINADKLETGVEAFRRTDLAGGNQNRIDLRSIDYGSDAFITLTEIQGASQTTGGGSTGTNALALVTDTRTGQSRTFEADGRTFTIDFNGVKFEVDLFDEVNPTTGGAVLAENNNLNARTIRFYPGGTPTSTGSSTYVGIPELDGPSLGAGRGGLTKVDLVNDPGRAIEIFELAANQIGTALDTVSSRVVDLSARVAQAQNSAATLDESIQNAQNLSQIVRSFERTREEARRQDSLALLAQFSGLFPVTIQRLLGL